MICHKKKWRLHLTAAAFTAVAVAILPVSARVFRIVGQTGGHRLNTDFFQWTEAYTTRMTVNGRKYDLYLYSARYTEPVVAQLRDGFEQLGAKVRISETSDGATGSATWPEGEARFLVLSPASRPNHLIFLFYPEGGTAASTSFPVPKYPRGKVLGTVSNDKTGTLLITAETTDSPTEVHSFYAGALSAQGWKMVAPATVVNGCISGMAVYTKKKKVCYVQATERRGKPNMITLLVKGGTI